MDTIRFEGISYPLLRLDAAVIGSGCAGLNALDCLASAGVKNIALFTEGRALGTSRNTGSDKQTYYKLSLTGGDDSVGEMARTLFAGEGVNGDTALCEAAGSVRAFMKLCELGVGFPTNEYGEYVGYKTDHDPRTRATSAGPLTSRYMTEALERAVDAKGLTVYEDRLAVELLADEERVYGFITWSMEGCESETRGLGVVLCPNVILATGGPAGCYDASVYPASQWGMSGMALRAGARGANLSEWQYGLASVDFRWNVSGTYQQVLPRYISVDENGTEREFLPDYFGGAEKALAMEFLKGYQWPFDASKVRGSSYVDLAVYRESVELGRKVYLDFRRDPAGLEHGFDGLSDEARAYLENSGATQKSPIGRLAHMNPLAIELYASHGIDLYTEPLRVEVCAQHHNGGLAVDVNWETNLRGLFAAGECAGNFGVHRPGGSALNATQVGSFRAASEIARRLRKADAFDEGEAGVLACGALEDIAELIEDTRGDGTNLAEVRESAQQRFTRIAAELRDPAAMAAYEKELQTDDREAVWSHPAELRWLFKLSDMLETQKAVLSSMLAAARTFGSRGSALVLDPAGEGLEGLLADYRFVPGRTSEENLVLYTEKTRRGYRTVTEPARPIPGPDNWFENVWREFREREDI